MVAAAGTAIATAVVVTADTHVRSAGCPLGVGDLGRATWAFLHTTTDVHAQLIKVSSVASPIRTLRFTSLGDHESKSWRQTRVEPVVV